MGDVDHLTTLFSVTDGRWPPRWAHDPRGHLLGPELSPFLIVQSLTIVKIPSSAKLLLTFDQARRASHHVPGRVQCLTKKFNY